MFFDALAPSSALQLTRFTDVDAFRPAESLEDARSIPLDVANFAAARATVNLPAFFAVTAEVYSVPKDVTTWRLAASYRLH